MATDININQLVINKLTQAQYQEAKEAGQIVDTELYMITDDAGGVNITVDTEIIEGSTNPVSGGAVYEALENAGGASVHVATIGTTWTENEDTGAKTQTVSIGGVLSSHTGKLDVVYNGDDTSDSYATFVEAQNQFLEFITNGFARTVDGGVEFTIFGEPNTVNIPFVLEVV